MILIDNGMPSRIYRVEDNIHRKIRTKEIEQRAEDSFCIGMSMNDDIPRSLSQAQRSYQSNQSQTMIPVQMADQNMSDFADRDFRAT